jgi:hypothetical protein
VADALDVRGKVPYVEWIQMEDGAAHHIATWSNVELHATGTPA